VEWKEIGLFKKPKWSLQNTITLLVCMVVITALLVTDILISGKISKETEHNEAEKAIDIARIVADAPLVIHGLTHKDDEEEIQLFANQIMESTNVEFVVVMDMNGIRKSHPNRSRIGEHFVGGDEGAVLKGKEHTSIAEGTLGVSLRSFTPVFDAKKKQIGAVAVGISLQKVQNAVSQSRKIIYIGVGIGLLVGIIGAVFLARKIKNILFGLEPSQIAKILEERSAMLQSTKEGIIAVDQFGRTTLVNNEGNRILHHAGINLNPIGKEIEDYMPNTRLHTVLETGVSEFDQEQDLNGITIVTNRIPIIVKGKIVGAIATFRDKTDIKQLAEQLTGAKLYAEALRAQSHEFMNKLHVMSGLIHMENYHVLSSYITQMVDHQQTEIGFVMERFKDPVLAGFILGKLSFARESGTELMINGEGVLPEPEQPDIIHEVVTILGNLIDNAIDAVKESKQKRITLIFDYFENVLVVEVHDTGKGMDDVMQNVIFQKGMSSKGVNRGFGLFLVKQSLERLDGKFEIYSKVGEGTTFIVTFPYKCKLT
jgi:two-component system, CitB family, sensor histidine kinase MalK